MRAMTFLIALGLLASAPSQAKVDPSKVGDAVEKGGQALLAKVAGGLPLSVNYNSGTQNFDELVFYALVHAGIDPSDKSFDKLLRQILTCPFKRTYQVSLIAMGLTALDPQKYQGRIAECAQYLTDLQCDNGQWDYGLEYTRATPPTKDVATGSGGSPPEGPSPAPPPKAGTPGGKIVIRRMRRGNAVGDNSNSQYAAMGLRACLLAGCEIEKATLEKALAWWEKSQLEDGSWNYGYGGQINPKIPGYGSMTAGGVASIAIWRKALGQDPSGSKNLKKGLDWLGKTFSLTENPKEPDTQQWFYYYLYALERVGDLTGQEHIGSHAWYDEGADLLLKTQNGGGMWIGRNFDFAISDTCFAILFLRRATRKLIDVASEDRKR